MADTRTSAKCPSSDRLQAWLQGKVSEEDQDRIAAHVQRCKTCETVLESLDGGDDSVIRDLRGGPDDAPPVAADLERLLRRAEALGSSRIGSKDGCFSDSDMPKQVGDVDLLECIGHGGMGAVYRGRHRHLEKIVAVKLLPADRLRDTRAAARFKKEMAAVGRLNHPNLVRASHAGEEDGRLFLVMEFLQGVDLQAAVRRRGPLPLEEVCELVHQAASGLAHAHASGIVHRDVKPANLLLTDDGVLKVLDLGLAKSAGNDDAPGSGGVLGPLTGTAQLMGTIDYIAPEQTRNAASADARSDIYSLGCTAYFLLTARAPFDTPEYPTDDSRVDAHRRDLPIPLWSLRPQLPQELSEFVGRMLAKDPADRPQSMGEVAGFFGAQQVLLAGFDEVPPRPVATTSPRMAETVAVSETATVEAPVPRKSVASPPEATVPKSVAAAGVHPAKTTARSNRIRRFAGLIRVGRRGLVVVAACLAAAFAAWMLPQAASRLLPHFGKVDTANEPRRTGEPPTGGVDPADVPRRTDGPQSFRRGFGDTVLQYADRSYADAKWERDTDLPVVLAATQPEVASLRIDGWDDDCYYVAAGFESFGRDAAVLRCRDGRWNRFAFIGGHLANCIMRVDSADSLVLFTGIGNPRLFRISSSGTARIDCPKDLHAVQHISLVDADTAFLHPGDWDGKAPAYELAGSSLKTLDPASSDRAVLHDADGVPQRRSPIAAVYLSQSVAPGRIVGISGFTPYYGYWAIVEYRNGLWHELARIKDLPNPRDAWIVLEGDDLSAVVVVAVGNTRRIGIVDRGGGTVERQVPPSADGPQGNLVKAWGVDTDRFWVVDDRGSVWEWSSAEWREAVPPVLKDESRFVDAWISPRGNVHAVTKNSVYRLR